MKILMDDQTLFKNIEIFDNDFIPDQFNHRDMQIKSLSRCIKPGLKGSKPSNALIIGSTATGKTTSIKLLLNELKEYRNKIMAIYINCQIYNTKYKIFAEIYKQVFGYAPPPSGLPSSELFDEIFKHLSKKKLALLVIMDDSEIMFDKDNKIIYDILRCHEIHDGTKASVWCITHKNLMHMLSDRTRSIYNPDLIEYPKYTQKELVKILTDRVENGLYNEVLSKDLIEMIADNSFDLRYAIECIRKSALLAESDASMKIEEKHVKQSLGLN